LSWLFVSVAGLIVVPPLATAAVCSVASSAARAFDRVLPSAVALGLLCFVLRKLVGESAFNAAAGIAGGLFKVFLALAKALLKENGKNKSP
jgi:hypothetical protein